MIQIRVGGVNFIYIAFLFIFQWEIYLWRFL